MPRIIAPEGIARPHGTGIAQAQMHHKGDRGQLHRNAVGGQWNGAQPAHHHRRGGEQAHLAE